MSSFRFDAHKTRERLPGEREGKAYWRDHLVLDIPRRRLREAIDQLVCALNENCDARIHLVGELEKDDGE